MKEVRQKFKENNPSKKVGASSLSSLMKSPSSLSTANLMHSIMESMGKDLKSRVMKANKEKEREEELKAIERQ